VKELANRLQSANNTSQATTVGKWGYAPNKSKLEELIRSDLYALAVTAVVLLTGRDHKNCLMKPADLNWQRWVTVSPEFARVLNRMLSYQPVIATNLWLSSSGTQALNLAAESSGQPLPPQLPTPTSLSESSQIQTVAVGRHLDSLAPVDLNDPVVIPAPTPSLEPGGVFVWNRRCCFLGSVLGLC